MSGSENFLERWSRLKREGEDAPAAPVEERHASLPSSPEQESSSPETEAPSAEPADLSELPSLESISAETDVRGFLRPGVPADMTRAALRRAWSSDPAIRDFIGLVENGQDFNDPDAIPGFGRIAADEVSRLLGQAIGAEPPEAFLAKLAAEPPAPRQEQEISSETTASAPAVQEVVDAPIDVSDDAADAAAASDDPDILHRNIDVASQDKK